MRTGCSRKSSFSPRRATRPVRAITCWSCGAHAAQHDGDAARAHAVEEALEQRRGRRRRGCARASCAAPARASSRSTRSSISRKCCSRFPVEPKNSSPSSPKISMRSQRGSSGSRSWMPPSGADDELGEQHAPGARHREHERHEDADQHAELDRDRERGDRRRRDDGGVEARGAHVVEQRVPVDHAPGREHQDRRPARRAG